MHTVAHQRLLNTLLGMMMLLFGLIFFGASAYVYRHPPAPSGATPRVQGDVLTCERTLSRLGHLVRRQGDVLIAQRQTTTFDDAKSMLTNASIGISACGLPLLRFCMGPGCHTQGVSFSLSTELAATMHRGP